MTGQKKNETTKRKRNGKHIAVPVEKHLGCNTVFPKVCDFCPNLDFLVLSIAPCFPADMARDMQSKKKNRF